MFKFVAAIWIGKFHSEGDLMAYIARNPDHPGDPRSIFEKHIGVEKPFVPDLVEASFVPRGQLFEETLNEHSYSGFFSDELLRDMPDIPERDFNAMIIVYGQKGPFGPENSVLFDFNSQLSPDAPIQLIGNYFFHA